VSVPMQVQQTAVARPTTRVRKWSTASKDYLEHS
jgi:hypothetical protein